MKLVEICINLGAMQYGFEDAAEKMGVDVMRWLYASQNPEHNLLFGYGIADEVRKKIITLWNTYYFFCYIC